MSVFNTQNWWDPYGPFCILHSLTPLRCKWIAQVIGKPFLEKKKWCDGGCGGGILTQVLMQYNPAGVTGIDREPEAIACAKHYTHPSIDYHIGVFQEWSSHQRYDVVLLMEVLEHMDNPFLAVEKAYNLLHPGGYLIGSTLARTWASYYGAIIIAEKILKWVPRDTHTWQHMISPKETALMLETANFTDIAIQGYGYAGYKKNLQTLRREHTWRFQHSTHINYFFAARKPGLLTNF